MVVKKKKAVKRASAKIGLKTQAKARPKPRMKPNVIDASRSLAKRIAAIASEHKGIDILLLDLSELTSFTDFFVIVSGSSDRHVEALADAIRHEMKQEGRLPISEEGMRSGRWALIDYGDVVTHVFYTAEREHYSLEKLWHDAPRVNFKQVG